MRPTLEYVEMILKIRIAYIQHLAESRNRFVSTDD
jgi:hypothetical protein